MPAPLTSDEFLGAVRDSGILDSQRLDTHLQQLRAGGPLPEQPGQLAGCLVRDGLLTRFQAEQLLLGKRHHFVIGHYLVLDSLGTGGMATVYLCEHRSMRRRVAIKVLPASQAGDRAALERFYREARAVAVLNHPNIIRAYDIDQVGDLHFLVMEYSDGNSLEQLVKVHGPLHPLKAAQYIQQAAVGLEHAHQAGLVHRDIKPANLMVDRHETVKILDLGLARFFHDQKDDLSVRHNESVLGTADYLAPEQALDSHNVDHRADIYSLGATFYYLLTGRMLFGEGTMAQKLMWHQMRKPKPLGDLRPDVPEGLAAVVNRMLAKAPEERYQTAAEVVMALVPWSQQPIPLPAGAPAPSSPQLQGSGGPPVVPLPLAADTPGPMSSTLVFSSRNLGSAEDTDARLEAFQALRRRLLLLNAAGGSLLLILILVFLVLLFRQGTTRPTELAAPEPSRRETIQDTLRRLLLRVENPRSDPDQLRRDLLAFMLTCPGTPQALQARGLFLRLRSPLDHLKPDAIPPAKRFDGQPAELVAIPQPPGNHPGKVLWVREAADGTVLGAARVNDDVKVWDVVTGKERVTLGNCRTGRVHDSPDGKTYTTVLMEGIRTVTVWDAATGKPLHILQGDTDMVHHLTYAPDGRTLATASQDRTARLWDVATGKQLHVLSGHSREVKFAAFSPDGQTLATAALGKDINPGEVKLWDVATGQERPVQGSIPGCVWSLAFSPDGKALAAGCDRKTVKLWDVGTGQERPDLHPEGDQVRRVAFSADGKMLASADSATQVRVWDVASGKQRDHGDWHHDGITTVRFSPDGDTLGFWCEPGRLLVGNLTSLEIVRNWDLRGKITSGSWTLDGRHLIANLEKGDVYILRIAPPRPRPR